MFNCSYPIISSNIFKEYNWFDLYRDAKESIRPNMPESRGQKVSISMFVDDDIAGDKSTRRSQTGVLIFINKSPIHWYIKRQSTFESSTFGAEFCDMKSGVEMVEALQYNLRIFGVPVDGSANMFCDNKAVYKGCKGFYSS